jgi:hypothetical protein
MATTALPLPYRAALGSQHPALSRAGRALLWGLLAVVLTAAALLFGSKLAGPVAAAPISSFSASGYPVRAIEIDRATFSAGRLHRVPCAGRARRLSSCWVSSR